MQAEGKTDLFQEKKERTKQRVLAFFEEKKPKLSGCSGRLDVARFWYDGFFAWFDGFAK